MEWHDDRGFGFVVPNGGGERAFLHIKAFRARSHRPAVDQLVTYTVARDARGRARAEDVAFVQLIELANARRETGGWRVLLAGAFLLCITLSVQARKLPAVVLWTYLAFSVITLMAYAKDKVAARTGRWRTRESTLQLLALVGGWPGALVAQCWLRHKIRKASFQRSFWFTVIVNAAVLVWLLTPTGAKFLVKLLGA
ncbi:MAG TPA: DUF1294 domain-containing protein [Oleiagrimonas sp.]|nr:DUF1294 domain-containing protein [Oleiagrimonas sp.]